ncbi:MAG: uracil-DNA glycosylase family protein [Phycisphaerales bacterium JB050]
MQRARECRICEKDLVLGCRPLLQGSRSSRLLLIGQAPGAAAHESGVPWDDRSGQRLREWLELSDAEFYNPELVAILPMGFCYPGTGKSGDLRPRPECAPEWHERFLAGFEAVELTVCLGRYAFERYLSDRFGSVTEAVRSNAQLLPKWAALPHPSPRNNMWLKRNAWFEADVLPVIRRRVRSLLKSSRA